MSLTLSDQVVLTDLAYEKAKQLGMSLVSPQSIQPPAAPVRPYISKEQQQGVLALHPAPAFFAAPETQTAAKLPPAPINAVAQPNAAPGITAPAQISTASQNPTAGYPQAYSPRQADPAELRRQVREAVLLRVGKADPALLDKIIERIFAEIGIA